MKTRMNSGIRHSATGRERVVNFKKLTTYLNGSLMKEQCRFRRSIRNLWIGLINYPVKRMKSSLALVGSLRSRLLNSK